MLRAAVIAIAVLGAAVVGASTAAVLWSIPPDVRYEPTAGDPASSTMPTPAVAPTHPTSEQPPSSSLSEAVDQSTPRVGSVETLARVPLQRPDPQDHGCPRDGCEEGERKPFATADGVELPMSTPAVPAPTPSQTDTPPPVTENPPPPVEPPSTDSVRSTQNSDAPEE